MKQPLPLIRQILDGTHEMYIFDTMDNGLNSHNETAILTDL